jgi:predicted O-methyltransferase YrrM
MGAPFFDFVFLDHWKDRYMPDYFLLKEKVMIGEGRGYLQTTWVF